MSEYTSDASASSGLPDGTIVRARVITDADEPTEQWTTGPLRSLWVESRWGSWLRHEVNGMIVDATTIGEA